MFKFHKVVQQHSQVETEGPATLYWEFSWESVSKRTLKIGLHLPKLWSKVKCIIFFETQGTHTHWAMPIILHRSRWSLAWKSRLNFTVGAGQEIANLIKFWNIEDRADEVYLMMNSDARQSIRSTASSSCTDGPSYAPIHRWANIFRCCRSYRDRSVSARHLSMSEDLSLISVL